MAKENGTEMPAPAEGGSVVPAKGKRAAEDDEQGSEGDKEKKKRKVATPRKKPTTPRAGPKKKASGSASAAPANPDDSAKDHESVFAKAEEHLKGANGAPEGESEVGESELESEADEDAEGEPDGDIPAADDVVMADSARPVPATSTETLQVQDIEMGDAARPKTTRRQSTKPPKPRAKRAGKNAEGQVKGKELESEEGVSPPPGLNLLKGDGTIPHIAADSSISTIPGGAFTSAVFPSTTPGTTLPSSTIIAADGSMSAPPSVLALDPNSKEGLAQRKCKFCDHPPFTRAQDCLRHMEHSCQANPNRKVTEVCDECHMQLSRSDALKRHYKTCGKSKRKGGKGASASAIPGKSGSSSAIVTGSGAEDSPSVGPSTTTNGKGKEKEKSKSQSPDKGVEGEGAIGETGPQGEQTKTDDASKDAATATGANDATATRNAMVEGLLRAVEAARAAEMANANPSAPSAANGATATTNPLSAALPPSVALTQADAFSQAVALAQQVAGPFGQQQQQQGVPTTSSSLAGALGPAPAFVLDPALANATANTPVSLSAPGAPGVPPTAVGEPGKAKAPAASKEGVNAPAPVSAPAGEKGPAEVGAPTTATANATAAGPSQAQSQAAAAAAMLSAMNPAEQVKANEIANAIAAHLAIVHSQQQQQQQQQGTNGQGQGAGAGASGQ